jgi:hypothetical protein
MTFDEMTFDEMTFDEMTFDEMTFDEMTFDEMIYICNDILASFWSIFFLQDDQNWSQILLKS